MKSSACMSDNMICIIMKAKELIYMQRCDHMYFLKKSIEIYANHVKKRYTICLSKHIKHHLGHISSILREQ